MRVSFWQLLVGTAAIAICCRPVQASIYTFSGVLDASQVVDDGGSTSTATGFATVTVDTALFTITTDFTWSGLSGLADRAHLHDAPAGQSRLTPPNGDFFHEVLGLNFDQTDPARTELCGAWAPDEYCAPASGSTEDVLQLAGPGDGYGYPDFQSLLDAFLIDGVYLDIHTELYPSAEIRGQLIADVPEPAAVAVFISGLIGLAAARRRKTERAAA